MNKSKFFKNVFLSHSLALLIIGYLSLATVRAMSVTELQEKMAGTDASLESVRFSYVQEMHSDLSSEVRKSSGMAYFKRPKQLRVEQTEPETQLIVSAGKAVFIYTPRFNQVLKDSWDRWFSKNVFFPGLLGFSETFKKLKKEYRWQILGETDMDGNKTVVVQLNSNMQGENQQLKLWISQDDFIPRKTELVLGTLTLTTTLSSLQLNPELNSDLFRFRQPPHSEIIAVP